MLYIREVRNNLTEGQMLFNIIGENFLKIKKYSSDWKFMSRCLEIELVHLLGTGAVPRNRSYVEKRERKETERRWFVICHFQLVHMDFLGLNYHYMCYPDSRSQGHPAASLTGLEPKATLEVDRTVLPQHPILPHTPYPLGHYTWTF